jgi:pimeloyl-ACP methyl ester carboxylesterase
MPERRGYLPLAILPGQLLDPTDPPPGASDAYGNPDPEWLRIDWRVHLRRLRAMGTEVNYVDLPPTKQRGLSPPSPGVPILFVHGLLGAWQNFLEQLPYFSRTRRVIALDLPGFGASPVPEWELTISNYGKLVGAFCDALELDRCVLVGNSMGGFIAAEVAIHDPGRAERLVLISAAGISHARMAKAPAVTAARMAAAATPLAFRYRERALTRPTLRHHALRNVFYKPTALRSELLWENLHTGLNSPGFLAAVEGLVGYDFTDRLPEVEELTLIVWGRQDRVVPPRDGLEFERLIPNSRLVVFDRCGHVPQMEKPARFNALLEDFLEEPLPEAVRRADERVSR